MFKVEKHYDRSLEIKCLTQDFTKDIKYHIQRYLNNYMRDFVDKKLIDVNYGDPQLFVSRTVDGERYQFAQSVEFLLKDKDYIDYLEEENQKLRDIIKSKGL